VTVESDERAEPEAEEIRTLLFRAVRELLFNVVKHSHARTATVETRRIDEAFLQIAVSDSGVGFDAQKSCKESSGSGFGLFSIRERLTTVGGRLDIQSAPGCGCCCTITAPVGQRFFAGQPGLLPAPALPAGPQGGLMRASREIRVLVADSLAPVRQSIIRLLEEHSDIVVVGEAADGEKALDLVRHVNPDVIVMDMNMSRVGGIETTFRLKKEFPQIRVIGLSSGEEVEGSAALRHVGACAVLDRTNRLETLASVIRSSFAGAA
jgi:CheY-like chemotaxis protein/anti-sigma regulatory factor (Ser/Thr protein kinase)